jgi:hypothetical protein
VRAVACCWVLGLPASSAKPDRIAGRLRGRPLIRRWLGAALVPLLGVAACGAHERFRTASVQRGSASPRTRSGPAVATACAPWLDAVDGSFVSDRVGFVLFTGANAACSPVIRLRETTDGGRSFAAVQAPPAGGHIGTVGIAFANARDGWAFGSELYETRDGARSWNRVRLGGHVVDLADRGRRLVALIDPCPLTVDACPGRIEASTNLGRTWRMVVRAPAGYGPRQDLLILNDDVGVLTTGDRLMIGRNGLRDWSTDPLPCRDVGGVNGALGGTTLSDLWLVCGGVPAMTEQQKYVYRRNGTGRWRLVLNTPITPHDTALEGLVQTLVVTSSRIAFMTTARGEPLETSDAGRHWRLATTTSDKPLTPEDQTAGSDNGWISFPSEEDGFLGGAGIVAYRTIDRGKKWSVIHP